MVEARVAVEGGSLHVGVWRSPRAGAPAVIAIHGGTSSHRVWYRVVDALARRAHVIAPDFRGANGSEGVGPPYRLRAHAGDVARVVAHFGLDRAVVAGWSLGGFIAANAAELLGDVCTAAVLVDGGIPLPLPGGFDPDAMQDVLIEPAMKRYRMALSAREQHREIWRAHPSLDDATLWTPQLIEAIDDEVEDAPGGLRFRVNLESLRADVLDTLRAAARTAAERVGSPLAFVWAERALENEPVGYYPLDSVREFAASHPMNIVEGHGLNHYTLMLSLSGARLVASTIASYLGE